MVIVRNVFQVKFGKSKEAVSLFKEATAVASRLGMSQPHSRLLTDVTGDFYTLVLEHGFETLGEFEESSRKLMAHPEWQAIYGRILPLLDGGRREILNLVQ